MRGIKIRKIKAFGDEVETSEVDFSDGLTIIQGPSNTGKSIILECIDFCFCGDKNPKIKKYGYTAVTGEFESSLGKFTITRRLNDKDKNTAKASVISEIPGFESGEYKLNKDSEGHSLSDLLLKAIGIDEKPRMVKNISYESQNLTWRMVSQFCLFKVTRIARESSILLPEQVISNTPQLSTLVFLTTGKDIAREHDPEESEKSKKDKKNAVKYFVKVQIQEASSRVAEIDSILKRDQYANVDVEIQKLLRELSEIENEMSPILDDIKAVNEQLAQLEKKYSELNILADRFDNLETQLESDIKRLVFIMNGEVATHDIPENEICPFCHNPLSEHKQLEYSEAAAHEIPVLTAEVNGLRASKIDVANDIQDLDAKRVKLQGKREILQKKIEAEYQPKTEPLRARIQDLRHVQQLQAERQVLKNYSQQLSENAEKIPVGKPTDEYKPREYFEDQFEYRLSEIIQEILSCCEFPGLVAVTFNKDSLDIEINGASKAENNGFGYCSFLNAVVAIGLQQYFYKYAAYDPGFLVIDTPLLGFDEGNYNSERKNIRKGLYQYLIDHQDESQTIILENTESIPSLSFEEEEVKMYTFTGELNNGRTGFLLSGYPWGIDQKL